VKRPPMDVSGPKPWRGLRIGYHEGMVDERAAAAIRELVDRYRVECLWFLRADYYPQSPEDVDRVLRLIEQYGDLDALRQWL
jgi:hypothetical protein